MEKLKLQLLILQLKLRVLLLRQQLTIPNLPKPKFVVVHHGGGRLDFNGVNEYHKKLWNFRSSLGYYAGYHKFIEYTGKLHIARRDNEKGAHTVEKGNANWWNENSVGICLQGNFENEQPTQPQLDRLREELDKYNLPVKMHCEISPTLCPGKNLKKLVENYRLIKK
jgi:N-acetylmuramoyl-L-alanine amidase